MIIGPHATSLDDVLELLWGWRELEKGVEMDIEGSTKIVFAWIMMYVGDMPQ
jgi:hypothetical protein